MDEAHTYDMKTSKGKFQNCAVNAGCWITGLKNLNGAAEEV